MNDLEFERWLKNMEKEVEEKDKEFKKNHPEYKDDEELFTECNCDGKFPW